MLSDFINKFFNKDYNKWNSISSKDKDGFYIILNRMMSIKHPILANDLNLMYINKNRAIDWWHDVMSKQYFKVPGWVWTKTKFSKTDKEDITVKIENYQDDIIKKYLEYNKISKKELNDAFKLFNTDIILELNKFEEFMKGIKK